jgi:hypothetical protein
MMKRVGESDRVVLAEPPISLGGNPAYFLSFSWESPANCQLRSSSDLGQGAWSDGTSVPVINGQHHSVPMSIPGLTRFYRIQSR